MAIGFGYPFVMTGVLLWLIDQLVGLRVDANEMVLGLDLGEYGETGYMLDFGSALPGDERSPYGP